MKSKKQIGKPSITLVSATFCRTILTDQPTNEISLIGLLPNLRIIVQKTANLPAQIHVPLGSLCVHAVFKSNSEQQILEETLDVQIHLPGQASSSTTPLKIENSIGQLSMKFMNPVISLPSKETTEHLAFIEWSIKGNKLGRVELPIEVIIKNADDSGLKQKDLTKGKKRKSTPK